MTAIEIVLPSAVISSTSVQKAATPREGSILPSSKVYSTSSAVNSLPSCQVMPSWRVSVIDSLPVISCEAARPGSSSPVTMSKRSRVS